jgi:alkylmercury lyase
MTALTLDHIAAAVIDAFPKLSQSEQRVALTLYRLLAKGRPATVEQISMASGISADAVGEMIGRWHGVERSGDGAVTAFWGLTLSKTKHRFRIGDCDLHTWCGWDTLFLPPLLGATGEVDSTCPASGERITLSVGPRGVGAVQPPSVVLSFVLPRASDVEKNPIETFCCHVHFLASLEVAQVWIAQRPGTFLLSLAAAWGIGLRKNLAQYPSLGLDPLLLKFSEVPGQPLPSERSDHQSHCCSG